jgi:seryl-tRNA synthetase
MSESKTKREIELLVKALDDEPLTDQDAHEVVRRLGIDTKAWAADIRKRVVDANDADRKERFEVARRAYTSELEQLSARKPEPTRSIAEQRAEVKRLLARAPREMAASVHAHKFEQATEEELAEMIRSLRHLLRDDEEP